VLASAAWISGAAVFKGCTTNSLSSLHAVLASAAWISGAVDFKGRTTSSLSSLHAVLASAAWISFWISALRPPGGFNRARRHRLGGFSPRCHHAQVKTDLPHPYARTANARSVVSCNRPKLMQVVAHQTVALLPRQLRDDRQKPPVCRLNQK